MLLLEDMDVYRLSVEFDRQVQGILRRGTAPRWDGDQLHRASGSILLNLAEGHGETSRGDKARFYRMAQRSCAESRALLNRLTTNGHAQAAAVTEAIETLDRVQRMLTRLIQRFR